MSLPPPPGPPVDPAPDSTSTPPPPQYDHREPAGYPPSWQFPRDDRQYVPPPSKAMAGWALGLAIVPCFGITTLVSLGLSITVLVRSARNGVNHGKGLAIAAVVIATCWLAVIVVATVLGVVEGLTSDPDRDADGRVTGRGEQSTLKIRSGDCFDYPAMAGAGVDDEVEAVTVEAVPCDEPHQFEAYHELELPDGDYPGTARVQELAVEACFGEFKGFVGIGYGRSDLEPYFLYPQSTSWRLLDDRSLLCFIGEPGKMTTGTLAGSRR